MKQHADGGRALRVAWSDALCDRLSRTIAREAPEGIGRWDALWTEYLAGPDAALRDALHQWEETGSPVDKHAASTAAARCYTAWQEARQVWRADPERAAG
jgi:hypothetical protein